ncbi:uncharacterized protein BP5553_00566 [Venustampulla echinocandica]|uniref:RING-type domain-containing protein n=1 Tax=Venustampulla echinocandica TaxID=2656787 RepID=A0A370TYH8_9HELO|nr:uncharacterized protein BP5553_00566 [Venustampulla echinocandica]RDL40587.1 hypothetical protein BP5553_00566 [Venustampulla echinocandica]
MTAIPDPESLLDVYPGEGEFTCVGTTQKGVRCRQSFIARRDLREAEDVLETLSQRIYRPEHPTRLLPILTRLAELTLCPRWHRFGRLSQIDRVANRWLMIIQDLDDTRRANERTSRSSRPAPRASSHQPSSLASSQAVRSTQVEPIMPRPAQRSISPSPSQRSRILATRQVSIPATSPLLSRTSAPLRRSSPPSSPQVSTPPRPPRRSTLPPPSTPPHRAPQSPATDPNEVQSDTVPAPASQSMRNATRPSPAQLPATASSSSSSSSSSNHSQTPPETPVMGPQMDSGQIRIKVTMSSGGHDRSSTTIVQRFHGEPLVLNATISLTPSPPGQGAGNLTVDINNDGASFRQNSTPSRASRRSHTGSATPSVSSTSSSNQSSRDRRSQNPSVESGPPFPGVVDPAQLYISPPQSPLAVPPGSLSISSDSEQAAPAAANTPDSWDAMSLSAPSPPASPRVLAWAQAVPPSPGRPSPNPRSPVQRRPLTQPCPVCYLELTDPEDTVWCRSRCGQNVCRDCFDTWSAHRAANGLAPQCVYWYITLSSLGYGKGKFGAVYLLHDDSWHEEQKRVKRWVDTGV